MPLGPYAGGSGRPGQSWRPLDPLNALRATGPRRARNGAVRAGWPRRTGGTRRTRHVDLLRRRCGKRRSGGAHNQVVAVDDCAYLGAWTWHESDLCEQFRQRHGLRRYDYRFFVGI